MRAFYKEDSSWLNLVSEKRPVPDGELLPRAGGPRRRGAGRAAVPWVPRRQTAGGHAAGSAACPGPACSPGRVGVRSARPGGRRVSLPPFRVSAATPQLSPRPAPFSLLRTLEKMNHEAKKRKPFSDFPVFFLHFTVSLKFLLHLTFLQVCCNYFPKEAALLLAYVSRPRLL